MWPPNISGLPDFNGRSGEFASGATGSLQYTKLRVPWFCVAYATENTLGGNDNPSLVSYGC